MFTGGTGGALALGSGTPPTGALGSLYGVAADSTHACVDLFVAGANAGCSLTAAPIGTYESVNGGSTQYIFLTNAIGASSLTNFGLPAPLVAPIKSLYVQLSAAPGSGDTMIITLMDGATAESLTCTVSGASATTCNDTTHSFTPALGDLLTWRAVSTSGSAISAQIGAIY